MITPEGEIIAATHWNRRETLVTALPGARRMITPVMAWGRWIAPALLGTALVLVASALLSRGRGAPAPADDPLPQGGEDERAVKAGGGGPRKRGRSRNKPPGKEPRPSGE
jgi:hypothetical protein